MAARVTAESIIELILVRLLADVTRVKSGTCRFVTETANNVFGGIGDVGLAAREEIWPRLATHVLDAADEEECGADGHEQA